MTNKEREAALDWVKDAFADIDESRVKLRKTTPVLDRAENCLKTIRAALQPVAEVDVVGFNDLDLDFMDATCYSSGLSVEDQELELLELFYDGLVRQGRLRTLLPHIEGLDDALKNADAELEKLINRGGRSFIMRVPAKPTKDTDLIFATCIKAAKAYAKLMEKKNG